ncbi:MAG: hypothetical protein Kow0074_24990 [Candidatus Zixiibacteriota bacterium]
MSNHHADRTVLYLTHNYPRHSGDFAGAFIARLAELVVQRGHRAIVIAPHAPGTSEQETVNGVDVHRFRYASDEREVIAYRGEVGKIALWGSQGIGAYNRFLRSFTRAGRTSIREHQPDVIHAHWWIPGGLVASRLPGETRVVLTMHGTDIRMLSKMSWIRPLARRVFRRADAITVVSSPLAALVERQIPDADRKLSILPMPPNDEAFTQSDSAPAANTPPVVLCVTRFTEQKRNAVLLKAAARLASEGVDLRLKLIGKGPLEDDLRAMAAGFGLEQIVEFAPPMPQDQLASEYARADLVVLPSVDEGLGMVLIEAQMCGTAVLGVRSGGIVDIIEHDDTGWLTAPDDVDALADGIRQLLSDANLRHRLAAAGRKSALSRFSSRAIVERFLELYGISRSREHDARGDVPT